MTIEGAPAAARRVVAVMAALLALALPLVLPPAAQAAVPGPLSAWNVTYVGVSAADAAYDSLRDVLLVTTDGSHPGPANELMELDPETGAIGRRVFVGSYPGAIALTDDGTTAYVGLSGANAIAEVDLETFTVSSTFSTGSDPLFGPTYVEDIEAVPGRNDMVVASLRNRGFSPRHEGVWVFDDGVALPSSTPGHTGANRIEIASATTVYGYNNETTEFGFRTIAVGETGATVTDTGTSLVSGFGVDIELAGGLVYSTTGKVIQPATRAAVRSFPASGLIEVTPADNRITFLSGTQVSRFDTTTGAPVDSRAFPDLFGTASALVASGTGFAAAGPSGVFLLGPSVSGGFVNAPPGAPTAFGPFSEVTVPLRAAAMEYDAGRDLLYVSVPSGAPAMADNVVALDPATGEVADSVFVGSDPGPLALSGDGTLLHVGQTAAGRIARIDLAAFEVAGSFSLGTGGLGPLAAEDIEVQPGTANRLAVSLRNLCCSPRHEGDAIFDDGVRLAESTPGHTGANSIEFTDATTLVGTNNETTGFEFYRMAVSVGGVTRTATTGRLLPGFGTQIEVSQGLVYASSGLVADPDEGRLVGRYAGGGALEPVPALGRTFVARSGRLEEYELATFRPVAAWDVDLGPGTPRAMITTSAGLAVSSDIVTLLVPEPPTPPVVGRTSTEQHTLAGSDGTTWVPVDAADPGRVTTRVVPAADGQVLVTGNADLWTFTAGFNQDLAVFMRVNGSPWWMMAWKESGGFAGTFSPNAASVQALVPVHVGNVYEFQLRWKANKAGSSTIAAGAGPIGGSFSPTSISTELVDEAVEAVSTQQYTLTASDGVTWHPVDAANPANLTARLSPSVGGTAVVTAGADLWTWTGGFNQDLAIFVSDNGGPYTLAAWKESGGFAGTFSPNAAAVQARVPVTAGHTYDFRLYWKANKAGASKISAGAGPIDGDFSPTSLVAVLRPAGQSHAAVSTQQHTLTNSDGATWHPVDAANLTLPLPALAQPCTAMLTANADLWTWAAGFNQDLALFVRQGGGPWSMVAWKESGGFAGTFSPNAAAVQAAVDLVPGQPYEVQLRWKANKPGNSQISAGAGPVGGQFSLTSLAATTAGCA